MPDKLAHAIMVFAILAAVIQGSTASGRLNLNVHPLLRTAKGRSTQPDAPMRSSVGKGYYLSGVVKSAKIVRISPEPGLSLACRPNGNYDDEHRATLLADPSGRYVFESNFPPKYTSRPPHIHIRVTADGFKTLVTQHYPEELQGDVVLGDGSQMSHPLRLARPTADLNALA
jgi:hypothetical protein